MDLMLDLETLGTTPGCKVMQIGAVLFDPEQRDAPKQEFLRTLDWHAQDILGLTSDRGTFDWWMRQPEVKRQAVMFGKVPLVHALHDLYHEFDLATVRHYWSRGHFDYPILTAAARAVGAKLPPPWETSFRARRDVRTVLSITGVRATYGEDSHTALADCLQQIGDVQTAYERTPNLRS